MVLSIFTADALAVPNVRGYQGKFNDPDGVPIGHDVELGTHNPFLPEVFDNDDLYIGITVGVDPEEMISRQRVTSGAFAMKACRALFAAMGFGMYFFN